MVCEINATEVEPEEVLTDAVYYFSNKNKKMEKLFQRVHKIYPNGGDGYRNIDIVSKDAYELIHTKDIGRAKELIIKLTSEGLWDDKALKKTNNYRILVGNAIIE